MPARLLVAAFLLAHAAIHAGFISPSPPATAGAPPWPFDLTRSWLVGRRGTPPGAIRMVGFALVAASLGGYALATLATLGVLPPDAWGAPVAVGSVASLVLLILFFHPWLVLGVAIDLLLLWVALVAGWTPDLLG